VDRVREKVLLPDENTNRSSGNCPIATPIRGANVQSPDWIVHGILDGVVDSFFPFLAQIENEVDQVEKVLYSNPDVPESVEKASSVSLKPSSESTLDPLDEKDVEKEDDKSTNAYDEKPPLSPVKPHQRAKTATFSPPSLPVSLHIRRARRFLKSLFSKTSTATGVGELRMEQQINPATRTVYRMVKIRRLVTSLTRLLSTKVDLIGQIRKRLVSRGEWSLDGDLELYIHLGDILGQQFSSTDRFHPECRQP
jgi:magnesium transporter